MKRLVLFFLPIGLMLLAFEIRDKGAEAFRQPIVTDFAQEVHRGVCR